MVTLGDEKYQLKLDQNVENSANRWNNNDYDDETSSYYARKLKYNKINNTKNYLIPT